MRRKDSPPPSTAPPSHSRPAPPLGERGTGTHPPDGSKRRSQDPSGLGRGVAVLRGFLGRAPQRLGFVLKVAALAAGLGVAFAGTLTHWLGRWSESLAQEAVQEAVGIAERGLVINWSRISQRVALLAEALPEPREGTESAQQKAKSSPVEPSPLEPSTSGVSPVLASHPLLERDAEILALSFYVTAEGTESKAGLRKDGPTLFSAAFSQTGLALEALTLEALEVQLERAALAASRHRQGVDAARLPPVGAGSDRDSVKKSDHRPAELLVLGFSLDTTQKSRGKRVAAATIRAERFRKALERARAPGLTWLDASGEPLLATGIATGIATWIGTETPPGFRAKETAPGKINFTYLKPELTWFSATTPGSLGLELRSPELEAAFEAFTLSLARGAGVALAFFLFPLLLWRGARRLAPAATKTVKKGALSAPAFQALAAPQRRWKLKPSKRSAKLRTLSSEEFSSPQAPPPRAATESPPAAPPGARTLTDRVGARRPAPRPAGPKSAPEAAPQAATEEAKEEAKTADGPSWELSLLSPGQAGSEGSALLEIAELEKPEGPAAAPGAPARIALEKEAEKRELPSAPAPRPKAKPARARIERRPAPSAPLAAPVQAPSVPLAAPESAPELAPQTTVQAPPPEVPTPGQALGPAVPAPIEVGPNQRVIVTQAYTPPAPEPEKSKTESVDATAICLAIEEVPQRDRKAA